MASTKITLLFLNFFFFISFVFASPLRAQSQRGLTLELVPRRLGDGNPTRFEDIQRIVQVSEPNALRYPSPAIDLGYAFTYMVRVGVGAANLHLLLDTGSSAIWTQVVSCDPCFPQEGDKYDPTNSFTFSLLEKDNPLCLDYQNGECVYWTKYNDGSFTKGILAKEAFFFETPTSIFIQTLVFGCSNESSTAMFASLMASGIMGMGRGPDSLPMQLASNIGGRPRFSYCLVDSSSSQLSYLRFGSDIKIHENAQHTPFVQTSELDIYYLTLHHIGLNGNRLNVPSDVFALRSNGVDGGCSINTGSPLSYFITPAYNAVVDSMIAYFEKHGVPRRNGSDLGLDLCFQVSENLPPYPSIELYLERAVMKLEGKGLFFTIGDRFCLSLLKSDSSTLIGAAQQVNYQFVYDIGKERLYFAPADCAQS